MNSSIPYIPYIAYMPFILSFILGALSFVVMIVIIVVLFRYLLGKKQLEHQQILAAIEKGTPLSELRPVAKKGPDWIRSLTAGIALLLIGLGMAFIVVFAFFVNICSAGAKLGLSMATIIFLSIGIGGVLRGTLQRKADKALSSDNSALDANHGQ